MESYDLKSAGSAFKCSCGGVCKGDTASCAALIWEASFMEAMKRVQLELLTERIKRQFGSGLEKAADSVLAAMEARWRAQLSEEEARQRMRTALQDAMTGAVRQ